MDSRITTIAKPCNPPTRLDARNNVNSEKSNTEQRRPTRRNPEKRRQQNIQAQKKYREYLLMSLHSINMQHPLYPYLT